MLLVLMLAVAVLTITMLGVARNYRRSIVRDREVEMMHRGDQYSRAIKRYYKKNGTYPNSIEQLEKTNNIRYLRKRYMDPMSPDGAWKLVHATDIKLTSGGLAGEAASTGAPQNPNPSNAGDLSAAGTAAAAQNPASSNTGTSTGGTGGAGGTSASGTGSTDASATAATGTTTAATGNPAQGTVLGGNVSSSAGTNNAASSGQVLGGGAVLGVVSKSKAEGIHSFGDKTKYNEWFFIYDPSQDKGQMLIGPYNPNMYLGANAGAGLGNPTSGTPASPGLGSPGGGMSGTGAPGSSSPNPPSTPASPTSAPSTHSP
jgi:type II secretory pathway pseudopilin PulG